MNIDRRQLVIGTAGAAVALAVPTFAATVQDEADIHIELHAAPDRIELRAGAPTRVWRYKSRLLRGNAGVPSSSATHFSATKRTSATMLEGE